MLGPEFAEGEGEEAENDRAAIGEHKGAGYSLLVVLTGGRLQEGVQFRGAAIKTCPVVASVEECYFRHRVSRRCFMASFR